MCALSAIDWNQAWRSVDSTRLPPIWEGLDPSTRRYMCVEFVVVFRLSSIKSPFRVLEHSLRALHELGA